MAKVPYVRYGGNPLVRQPFEIRQVTGSGFAVGGDVKKIQALCDLTLNHPGRETRYKVLSSTVLITFMRMGRLSCQNSPESGEGAYLEHELNITIPLVAGHFVGPVFVPERLVWFMPYLWLDSNAALIAGREIYGFPKQYGVIAMPPGDGAPATFCASGEVLHCFSPQALATTLPIVRARRTDAPNLEFQSPLGALDDAAVEFFREAIRVTNPLLAFWAGLANLRAENLLTLVFLRQFPSIADSAVACYRSIAEAGFDLVLDPLPNVGFLEGDYEVEIIKHDSVLLAAELGFAATSANGDAVLHPHAAYFVELAFTLQAGREIPASP